MKLWFFLLLSVILSAGTANAGAKKASEGHPGVYDDAPGVPGSADEIFDPYQGYQSLREPEQPQTATPPGPEGTVSWLAILQTDACSKSWNCLAWALDVGKIYYPSAGRIRDACYERPSGHEAECVNLWLSEHAKTVYLPSDIAIYMITGMCYGRPTGQEAGCIRKTQYVISHLHEDINAIFDSCNYTYNCLAKGLDDIADELD